MQISFPRWSRRAAFFTLFCACLFVWASPASAAVTGDLNGDGVTDQILTAPDSTRIVVLVSGAAPQVLSASDRLLSTVVMDIDRDGDLDLGALSASRGVLIWINHEGEGRLEPLRRRHGRAPPVSVTPGAALSDRTAADDEPATQPERRSSRHLATIQALAPRVSLVRVGRGITASQPRVQIRAARPASSRAPPFSTFI